jgi:hypothetical protein
MRILVALLVLGCGSPPVSDIDLRHERKELDCGRADDPRKQEACRILDELERAQPFDCPTDDAIYVGKELCTGKEQPPQLAVWRLTHEKPDDEIVGRSEFPKKALLGCAQDLTKMPASDDALAAVASLAAGQPASLSYAAIRARPQRWSPIAHTTGASAAALIDGGRAFVRQAGAKLLVAWPSPYGGCYREMWRLRDPG